MRLLAVYAAALVAVSTGVAAVAGVVGGTVFFCAAFVWSWYQITRGT